MSYHVEFRPRDFSEVRGQQHVVKPLQDMLAKKLGQCFLFAGPTGVGKTTLARIVASKCKVQAQDIVEFDASTHTGIDDIRELQQLVLYRPFSGGNRAIIIDEAHGLSKQAWNALLKVTEEPPDFIYFFLCTTDPGKVPPNIKTRFARFDLKPLPVKSLTDLLRWVCEEVDLKVVDEDLLALAAEEADGSARQALQNLAKVEGCKTLQEAAKVLESARLEGEPNVLAFMQFVLRPGSWQKGMAIIDKLQGVSPEGVRIQTLHYLTKVAKGAKTDKAALDALRRMDAFASPYNTSDGHAPLVLSLGQVLFD